MARKTLLMGDLIAYPHTNFWGGGIALGSGWCGVAFLGGTGSDHFTLLSTCKPGPADSSRVILMLVRGGWAFALVRGGGGGVGTPSSSACLSYIPYVPPWTEA